MAKKKKKHGKIEKKKNKPFMQFKLGVLLLLIVVSFGGTFGMYLFTAATTPDYWKNEVVGNSQGEEEENLTSKNRKSVTNPVPESERAEDSYMSNCAFIGDVSPLTGYYETKSELVFTDNVTGMSESRMNSISRNITEAGAVYIWYNYPENETETLDALKKLVSVIQEQHNTKIYLLNVIPDVDTEQSWKIDQWNSQLFAFCDAYAVHYLDINTSLKKSDGTLSSTYRQEDALYQEIGELILTHIAK